MTDFPTLLYKCPGPWSGNGYTFGSRPADNESEFAAALADGWHETVPKAVEAWKAPKASPTQTPSAPEAPPQLENAPPSREEIERKCAELGIPVHHKNTDATLLKKIEEALAQPKEPAGDVDQA